MKKLFFLLILSLLPACSPKVTFSEDPFCISCIRDACSNELLMPDLEKNLSSMSSTDQAQFIALMEKQNVCENNQILTSDIADKAYQNFGAAFFDVGQPMSRHRMLRALDEIIQNTSNRGFALAYLQQHIDDLKKAEWAKEKLSALSEKIEDDDIFSLLIHTADEQLLERMSALPSSPHRDAALLFRWKELSDETKGRVIGSRITAEWNMQTSGSSVLPQYLTLTWKKHPFPEGVPDFVSTLRVESVKIQNNDVKRGEWKITDEFQWPVLSTPDTRRKRIDLQPWLNTADSYKISAKAVLKIWPEKTSEICLNDEESCEETPILTQNIVLEKTYKVFIGVETGAPSRVKADKENLQSTKSIAIDICNMTECVPIWRDGKKTKDRKTVLKVDQGADFYVQTTLGKADLPIASRLMARAGNGQIWREISAFYSYAPISYNVPVRSEISLGELCASIGKCNLELQLRPSLRMARRDPRISKYWGGTLELGTISLDIQNLTPEQIK